MTKDTYFARAQSEPEPGGRFANPQRPVSSGSVPPQPTNSPWHHWPDGQEPPLGIDVSAPVVVGTAAEVEASIRQLEASLADTEVKLNEVEAMVTKVERRND